MNKQAYSIKTFLELYDIGRTKLYEEIASGSLATYRVGRRRYISPRAGEDWQRGLEAAENPSLNDTSVSVAQPGVPESAKLGQPNTTTTHRDKADKRLTGKKADCHHGLKPAATTISPNRFKSSGEVK